MSLKSCRSLSTLNLSQPSFLPKGFPSVSYCSSLLNSTFPLPAHTACICVHSFLKMIHLQPCSPFTLTLSLHPHPLLPPTRPLPTCISQPFHLFTPLSPAPPPSAPTGIGKEFSWVDCWKDGTRSQKSQTQSTCAGHRGFPLGSMEWSLFGTLSVTAMQGLLEASSRVFLFGGGAQLPKDPALGFVPRVVGRLPSGILSSSHTQNLPPPLLPRASQARRPECGWGRRCPSLPLPLSPRAWGA